MKIGGFVKQSLIDYPGKIAAVIFTQGCNFRCGYCHNPQLVLPELFRDNPEHSLAKIFNYLMKHKSWLDGVVVTGGEPTIHKDLPEFLKEIKDYGYLVKLDTNGTNPRMLKQLIDSGLVDYIAMDIKAPMELVKYKNIAGSGITNGMLQNIMESVKIIAAGKCIFEFRTTLVSLLTENDILEIIQSISGKYFLQSFVNTEKLLQPGNYDLDIRSVGHILTSENNNVTVLLRD